MDAGANGTAEHAVHGGRAGAMLSRLGTLYTWGRNVPWGDRELVEQVGCLCGVQ